MLLLSAWERRTEAPLSWLKWHLLLFVSKLEECANLVCRIVCCEWSSVIVKPQIRHLNYKFTSSCIVKAGIIILWDLGKALKTLDSEPLIDLWYKASCMMLAYELRNSPQFLIWKELLQSQRIDLQTHRSWRVELVNRLILAGPIFPSTYSPGGSENRWKRFHKQQKFGM